jgi:hypothetical protein
MMVRPNISPANKPDTYAVDVDQALETLDYQEMVALSEMFERWALTETKIDSERRTQLIQWSADYERIAEFCGSAWTATEPEEPPSAMPFIARIELRARGLR